MTTSIEIGGRRRTFTVVGDTAGASGRALVLVFHGSNQDGAAHRTFTGAPLERLATDGRAVIAYLDGHRGNWNDARRESRFPARIDDVDDVAFARAVAEQLSSTHDTDPDRVFAVGYSNGGQMVFRLLHETPALLAGAVAIAATMPDREGFLGDFADTPVERPIPVTVVAGDADRIVPYDGGRMAWWARALFKVGGTTLSAPATAAYFARRNGIGGTPTSRTLPSRSRRTTTEVLEYPGPAPVTLVTVRGGGHTVPSSHASPAVMGRTGDDLTIDEMVELML